VLMFHKGRHTDTLHFHLGSDDEHTVHEAELVGILLGMHLIKARNTSKATAAIGVDNQAAIRAFASDLRNPGHHLAREALRIATQIEKGKKKKGRNKTKVTIRWTAGHEGIVGNELADREAKEAAKGRTSDAKLLPRYLRKPMLINPSAVKKAHNDSLAEEWRDEWRSSKRGAATLSIDKTSPSTKFLKAISNPKLSRTAASAIAQIRLTHFPLNGYLKRIGKIDNARCPACGEDEETIAHFLLRCRSYAHERWPLARHVAKKSKVMSMQTLLGDPQFTLPLAAYIHATSRFTKPGEQISTQTSNAAQPEPADATNDNDTHSET